MIYKPHHSTKAELKEYIRKGYRIAALFSRPDLTPRQGDLYFKQTFDPDTNQSYHHISQETADHIAQLLSYSPDQLATLPSGSNMGLSCGNPLSFANLQPNQNVLDLGCGGGIDSFLAGPQVAPQGKVIGIDMTPEMITKARNNKAKYFELQNLNNVEFRLAEFEHLPIPNQSIDVIISNGAISLSPSQSQAWSEIARVLKPKGHIAIADIALIDDLPTDTLHIAEDLVGSTTGAIPIKTYMNNMLAAGLKNITMAKHSIYVDSLHELKHERYDQLQALLPKGAKPSDVISTYHITATK
ncbi:methyltransferase domain-containing protein [Planctomycetota bacterium]|nr:methyltransferase domain-containing protein [Planctomycetota bacterium]